MIQWVVWKSRLDAARREKRKIAMFRDLASFWRNCKESSVVVGCCPLIGTIGMIRQGKCNYSSEIRIVIESTNCSGRLPLNNMESELYSERFQG